MPQPGNTTLTIIIVNWNAKAYLLRCVESIRDAGVVGRTEVIVVDNASRDGSSEAVRESYPSVRLIANTSNRGFAGGVNDGLKISGGQLILVLNPDIVLRAGSLEPLMRPFINAHARRTLDLTAKKQAGFLRHLFRKIVLGKEMILPQ